MGVQMATLVPPLTRLVEDYRKRCDVPVAVVVEVLGVTRATYYNWLHGKEPQQKQKQAQRILGATLKRAFDNQDLPYAKLSFLTKAERTAKIKEILLKYKELLVPSEE